MKDIFVTMQILFRMQSEIKIFELKKKITQLLLNRNRNILLPDVL